MREMTSEDFADLVAASDEFRSRWAEYEERRRKQEENWPAIWEGLQLGDKQLKAEAALAGAAWDLSLLGLTDEAIHAIVSTSVEGRRKLATKAAKAASAHE